jgi:IS5 family transposase
LCRLAFSCARTPPAKKFPSRRGASAAGRQSGWSACCGVYLVQQWYGLADEAVEDAFYDSQALRGFAGIELNRDPVPRRDDGAPFPRLAAEARVDQKSV